MNYIGSKLKFIKRIKEITLANRINGQLYIEPFVGGCNSIEAIEGPRIGYDNNYYLIQFWKAIQDGWSHPYISKEEYYEIKNNKDCYTPELVAHAGFNCSFRGKWFGGYASSTSRRDYIAEAIRNVERQRNKIIDIQFIHGDYKTIDFNDECIIYCDPPYMNTVGYLHEFNHSEFYKWCHSMKDKGHQIFISELTMPDDFECVLEMSRNQNISTKSKKRIVIEKLFVPKG